MKGFKGRVAQLKDTLFPKETIESFWEEKKMDKTSWIKVVGSDLFHLISAAVETMGAKFLSVAVFSLNEKQIDVVRKLGELWISLRGRETHPPNSQDSSAKKATRAFFMDLSKVVLQGKELVLVTILCPNHQFDSEGIFIDDKIHPKAKKAAQEFEEIRQLFRQAGVKNLRHNILFGDVDLSQALKDRFSQKELKDQLEKNFGVWKKLFSGEEVKFLKMTSIFSENEWEKCQREFLKKIQGGFLFNQVKKVTDGRGDRFARMSGRDVSSEEALRRTQDSVAAHLATNSILEKLFSDVIFIDASGAIDLLWTWSSTLCLSMVKNHQPWRD